MSEKSYFTTESGLCPYIWDAFPYVNLETLEFAYCDVHYQYIRHFTNVSKLLHNKHYDCILKTLKKKLMLELVPDTSPWRRKACARLL